MFLKIEEHLPRNKISINYLVLRYCLLYTSDAADEL